MDKCSTDAWIPEPERPLAEGPPFRRLFLDAMVTEESQGLGRVFHSALKHRGNPVLVRDRPWEGWGPYIYGTVMWDDGRLKMWYSCIGKGSGFCCYAESEDGVRWRKPDLGVMEHDGSAANNISTRGGLRCVFRLAGDAPAGERWANFSYGGKGDGAVVFGPDGVRWDGPSKDQLFSTSDVVNVFYDPYIKRFVATYKTSNRRHRAVGIACSDDGLEWRKPVEGPVFGADDLDPDPTQIYGMPVFPYQGIYIGLPWIYHARWIKHGEYESPKVMYEAQEGSPLTVDVQIAWSWDLMSWTRTPDRKPFIALGRHGAWDWGMIYTARAPVIVNERLCFYYGGCNNLHDRSDVDCAIGLATLRLDGFCSMRAGSREGWLVSRREVFRTPRVTVNASTRRGGYVVAEIVDRSNKTIPGFSRAECMPFEGDSIRHELEWRTKSFPAEAAHSDKKIRFYLANADLYSYLPRDIDQARDDGRIWQAK